MSEVGAENKSFLLRNTGLFFAGGDTPSALIKPSILNTFIHNFCYLQDYNIRRH